jgi:SAM-dependent methyltransferase
MPGTWTSGPPGSASYPDGWANPAALDCPACAGLRARIAIVGDRIDPKIETAGVASDGSPPLVYLALPGQDDAALIDGAVTSNAAVLELGCGAGRVTRHLAQLGHDVTAVDNSDEMLRHLNPAERIETVLADITTLDLSHRQWPVVVLASHLINDDRGASFLATAARHLRRDGCVLVERHQPGWIDTVEASNAELHGVRIAMKDIDRPAPGTLRATMVYEVNGLHYEQPFTAHEVDDQRLAQMAAAVGLTLDAILDKKATWARLVRP